MVVWKTFLKESSYFTPIDAFFHHDKHTASMFTTLMNKNNRIFLQQFFLVCLGTSSIYNTGKYEGLKTWGGGVVIQGVLCLPRILRLLFVSLWSKLKIGLWKWFLSTNLFLIKMLLFTFLTVVLHAQMRVPKQTVLFKTVLLENHVSKGLPVQEKKILLFTDKKIF